MFPVTKRRWFQSSRPQRNDSFARAGTLGVLAAGITALAGLHDVRPQLLSVAVPIDCSADCQGHEAAGMARSSPILRAEQTTRKKYRKVRETRSLRSPQRAEQTTRRKYRKVRETRSLRSPQNHENAAPLQVVTALPSWTYNLTSEIHNALPSKVISATGR